MKFIIDGSNAPVFNLGDVRFTVLAAPSRGSQENSVWRISMAPGVAPGRVHRVTREEVFVALAGQASVTVGAETATLMAGSALVVPPDTDFSIANVGKEPFEAVAVLPVGGHAVLPGEAPFVPPWAA